MVREGFIEEATFQQGAEGASQTHMGEQGTGGKS
jgi:hypothetical protein